MARIVSSGIRKRINKNCSPAGIREILKHTTCMGAVRSPLKVCYRQGLRDLYQLKEADKNLWHKLVCCFGSKAYDCAKNAVSANCEGPSAEYFIKESTQLVTEMTETFCPINLVWGRKECSDLIFNLPEPVVPNQTLDERKKTLMPVLIEIFKEFSGSLKLDEEI